MIVRDQPIYRTMHNLPRALGPVAMRTVEAIEADFPNLPAPQDEPYVAPPNAPRWRRRIASSSWWVVYTFDPVSETLILRTVNDLG